MSSEESTAIGRVIRGERRRREWTRSDLISRLARRGITLHESTLYRIETGRSAPRYDTLAPILSVLGIRNV